ncbi:MAG: cellulase family glycosylhydrolase [Thermoleophilaceae bacterium]
MLALAAMAALALAPGAAHAAPQSLRVDGARVADDRGGTVLLRGTALIRKSRPGLPTVGEADWQRMRELGFNTIRLGTAWGFIEPRRGGYDADYLDALASVARDAMDHGLYVIVDMHQDVWGPPLGNGAAEWTVYPECEPLAGVNLAALTGVWSLNYLAPWTFCQFTRFWDDPALQQHLAGAWREIARRLGDEPRLAGYDLLNEPFQGFHPPGEFETRVLYPFYDRLADAIRSEDADAIVFEEPANSKNVHLPTAPSLTPREGAVYAPHVYGLWDASDAFTRRDELIAANMAYSGLEARVMGTPLWYGEFGMRRGAPDAEASLTQIYDIADSLRAGTSYWEWSRDPYGPMLPDGSLDPVRALTLSRAYPSRTAGELLSFSFDAASGALSMRWRQRDGTGSTEIVLPPRRYPAGFDVVAGEDVRWRFEPGRHLLVVDAPAGERELRVVAR